MKKKFLTVLLAVATAAALYGCGPDEGGNTQTQAGTQAEETVKDTAKETEAAETEAPYEKGTVSDAGFESEWLNIRFTATENDVMATQEEIDSLPLPDSRIRPGIGIGVIGARPDALARWKQEEHCNDEGHGNSTQHGKPPSP